MNKGGDCRLGALWSSDAFRDDGTLSFAHFGGLSATAAVSL